ncbi:hypothetical protein HFC70_04805 [Agrobacterium sp. a22-2]|nr:hypothetical protein [Agrobacterium sp. a22-2]NKN35671.1 hypothetical protein [Agrobacterium sp. a22-2]
MLLVPAIHRRIVLYTENRLKATTPLSAQEVRAQKDMARAVYAAENARTAQELTREREKSMALEISNDTLAKETSHALAESQDLRMQIEEMSTEAGSLRSQLRREATNLEQMKDALQRVEETSITKDLAIEKLTQRITRLNSEIDNLKIEGTTRDTQIEDLRMRVQTLRDEREALRQEVKSAGIRAKQAEQRLAQEEHKLLRLEDKLTRAMATSVDKDGTIERHLKEIVRLKEKLQETAPNGRAALRSSRPAKPAPAGHAPARMPVDIVGTVPDMANLVSDPAAEALADELRHQHIALTERLLKARTAASDPALREEVAEIAAKMIALTALREGSASPIPALLAGPADTSGVKPGSLADRVARLAPDMLDTPQR